MQKFLPAIFLSAMLFALIFGCTQPATPLKNDTAIPDDQNHTVPKNDSVQPPATIQTQKGVSLSPKSYGQADFTGFFTKAREAGTIITWSGDWNELSTPSGAPYVVEGLSKQYNYEPIIIVQFFTQSSGELIRPLDAETKQKYRDSLASFAEKYKPAYLGIGIEVNTLYEKSPSDFEDFVSFYSEVYDAVKEKSPNTKVFTVFQLERMKGLHGGLFGGENSDANAEWPLLNKFPKSDLMVFTTYPGLIYKSPAEIPQDYYTEIKTHTSRPIAFTEVGWHSAASPKGWESSEDEQAKFVDVFFERAGALDNEFVIWSFLYDQNTIEPFNSMGLYSVDGTAKKSWAQWKNAK